MKEEMIFVSQFQTQPLANDKFSETDCKQMNDWKWSDYIYDNLILDVLYILYWIWKRYKS